MLSREIPKTSQQVIDYLLTDIPDIRSQQSEMSETDPDFEWCEGVISRSQTVLRMFGLPESDIPQ